MTVVRFLVLLLAVTLSGPPVASLLCDLACAAKHQAVPASASGCREHGADASIPRLARGHQCHELATPPESVLTSAPQLLGVLAVADLSAAIQTATGPGDRSDVHLHGPPHAPPPPLLPLRI